MRNNNSPSFIAPLSFLNWKFHINIFSSILLLLFFFSLLLPWLSFLAIAIAFWTLVCGCLNSQQQWVPYLLQNGVSKCLICGVSLCNLISYQHLFFNFVVALQSSSVSAISFLAQYSWTCPLGICYIYYQWNCLDGLIFFTWPYSLCKQFCFSPTSAEPIWSFGERPASTGIKNFKRKKEWSLVMPSISKITTLWWLYIFIT